MFKPTNEKDYGLFRELYCILAALADEPNNTIGRIGGGRISIPEDQANDLHNFRMFVLETYPEACELELMRVVDKINAILTRYSRGGESYDEWFWKNAGYLRHPDWDTIRDLAREFLMR